MLIRNLARVSAPAQPLRKLLLVRHGKVSTARLNFVTVFRTDLNFAEFAVFDSVGGSVSDVVLAAEFLRDLIKGGFELLHFIADFNDAAACLCGHFFHFAIASVTAEA